MGTSSSRSARASSSGSTHASSSRLAHASSSRSWKYHVFLSFRGEDTRKTFVDHLYSALVERVINIYKDDEALPRGDSIRPSLLKAIEESQIAVIIFSTNYADSSWCLDELAHIMNCRDEIGQIVLPIFYDVDPSEVRKQKGKFGKAFAVQAQKNDITKVESWRQALVDASNIAGWEPKNIANGHEAQGIKIIVGIILDTLLLSNSYVDENLVGMGTRLPQLTSQLQVGSGGVRMVGVWGVGGCGKSTLASCVYREISKQFAGCCIVDKIGENSRKCGLTSLQEKILFGLSRQQVHVESVDDGIYKIQVLLSGSKVLILLDNVDALEQLEALAGSHEWFGDGSRIIITTRHEHLLSRVDKVSHVPLLSNDEAIRLFNKSAYRRENPIEDYETLSQCVVSYAAGLPLALKVLGSFLYDKNQDEWKSTLAKLENIPNREITDTLRISYDGLDPDEKELFLDIACFFRGEEKNKAMEILDACGFHPVIGVKVLIQKALISIDSDGKFDMHDLVQKMGHYVVRGNDFKNPEKHSRVWETTEINKMCLGNPISENEKVEAIKYDGRSSRFPELVSNMKNLRLLCVPNIPGSDSVDAPTFLSNELMYLHMSGYLASPLPEDFNPTKLAFLKLRYSLHKVLWQGKKVLPCLKELHLHIAHNLVTTPDFGGLPCLQKLSLRHCWSLEHIDASLGNHASLVSLSLYDCEKLTVLPTIVRMEKLELLEISECRMLLDFPEIKANLDSLVHLTLNRTGIKFLPSSIGEYCTNLIFIRLTENSSLERIKGNFHALKYLNKFIVDEVDGMPKDLFDRNCCLEELRLPRSGFPHFPRFLKKLDLSRCYLIDGDIPSVIGDELSNLKELNLSSNCFRRLGFCLSQLTTLKLLNLSYCPLVELPELPSGIAILVADYCKSLIVDADFLERYKWLYEVSIWESHSEIGGDRLLWSMLVRNAIEDHSMSLKLHGLEIPKGFIPCIRNGTVCTIQLPHNWHSDFCGYLLCSVLGGFIGPILRPYPPKITMKHKTDGSTGVESECNFQNKSYNELQTWVGYVPFDSLRHTSWWGQSLTAHAISFSIDFSDAYFDDDTYYPYKKNQKTEERCRCFGVKLVPRLSHSGPRRDSSQLFDEKYDNRCCYGIQYDSNTDLQLKFEWEE